MKTISDMKEELKELTRIIRTNRAGFKASQKARKTDWDLYHTAADASYVFRHKHIAYCELRGRDREQIETPNSGNEPDESLIGEYKSQYSLPWEDTDDLAC